jgi:hypothetical protein
MTTTGIFNSGDILDISTFYEMSIFTNHELSLPLPVIMCSNDNINFVQYRNLNASYLYLSDLMANYIRVDSQESLTLYYNANLKK